MSSLKFYKGNEPALPIAESGAIYHCEDTGNTYLGNDEKKMQLFSTSVGKTMQNNNAITGEIFNNYDTNIADGKFSHAEGDSTTAVGDNSHAEGIGLMLDGTTVNIPIIGKININIDIGLSSITDTTITTSNLNTITNGALIKALDEYLGTFNSFIIKVKYGTSERFYPISAISKVSAGMTAVKYTLTIVDGYTFQGLTTDYHIVDAQLGVAYGLNAHVENEKTNAIGRSSHSEGYMTSANGKYAHAEGNKTTAVGASSHSEGVLSISRGEGSHAEGGATTAFGIYSHAEGRNTNATHEASHAEGYSTRSEANYSHAEGYSTVVLAQGGHAEGQETKVFDNAINGHAEGYQTQVTEKAAHAEGLKCVAIARGAHAEGEATTASGIYSHAEGRNTNATHEASHAEGVNTHSEASCGHAEGDNTVVLAEGGHAEGRETKIFDNGKYGHAEGFQTQVTEKAAHAEGIQCKAIACGAHAEGALTKAEGLYSHAEGEGTIATLQGQHTQGRYNQTDNTCAHILGWGESDVNRKNIHTIDTLGNAKYAGSIYVQGGSNLSNGTKLVENLIDGKSVNSLQQKQSAEQFTLLNDSVYLADDIVKNYLNNRPELRLTFYFNTPFEVNQSYFLPAGSKFGFTNGKIYILNWDYTFTLIELTDTGVATWQMTKGTVLAGVDNVLSFKSVYKMCSTASQIALVTNLPLNTPCINFTVDQNGCEIDQSGNTVQQVGWIGMSVDGYYSTQSGAMGEYSTVLSPSSATFGNRSFTHGLNNVNIGISSYTGGERNAAIGDRSHAEGHATTAIGESSHAEGLGTIASSDYQHVQGKYNIQDNDQAFILGNGKDIYNRSNAMTVDWNGNAWFANNIKCGGTSYDDNTAISLQNINDSVIEHTTDINNLESAVCRIERSLFTRGWGYKAPEDIYTDHIVGRVYFWVVD